MPAGYCSGRVARLNDDHGVVRAWPTVCQRISAARARGHGALAALQHKLFNNARVGGCRSGECGQIVATALKKKKFSKILPCENFKP